MENKDDFNFNDEFDDGQKKSSEAPMYEGKPTMYGGETQKAPQKSSKKPLLIAGALLLALVCFLAGWFGRYYAIDTRMRTLMWLVDTVEKKYYKEPDLDALYEGLYSAAEPDIFSAYLSADDYASVIRESEGTSSNFGIAVASGEGLMQVARVVGNSSAEVAGITEGMYIYRFGASAAELKEGDYNAFVAFLQTLGTKRTVFVECGFSAENKRVYEIESKDYLSSYCAYADKDGTFRFRGETSLSLEEVGAGIAGLDDDTAYIRLYEFEGNAADEFTRCLNEMKLRGKRNLVLDLRTNGGGYLNLLQSISSHFCKSSKDSNPVVATAKYRSGKTTVFAATGNDYADYFDASSKITVLADENSASASECLLGVLVSYGAVGYGDIYLRELEDGSAHTYGKGVMQSTYLNAKGEAFRLTAAEIFWPDGKTSIHSKGVTKEDGAHAVKAPQFRGEEDVFLNEVLSKVCSNGTAVL